MHQPLEIVFRRQKFKSLKELAKTYNCHYGNLVRRRRTGWPLDQALGLVKRIKEKKPPHNAVQIKTSKKVFSSFVEAASYTGIIAGTIQNRLQNLGWTGDQACGFVKPPRKKSHKGIKVVSKSGTYDSITAAAKAHSLSEKKVGSRLKSGWSGDQALDLVPPPQWVNSPKDITIKGETFSSLSACASAYKKNPETVRSRLEAGWTLLQALDIDPKPPRFRDQDGAARDHMFNNAVKLDDGQVVPETEVGSYLLYSLRQKSTGKEYIGITTNSLDLRLKGHWNLVARGRQSKLYNVMRKALKSGNKQDFEISLIRNDAQNFLELQEQEINEIVARDTIKKGFNTAAGGSIGTSKITKVDGKTFPSRQAAANFYNIPVYVFNLRISRLGYSPEEAAGIERRQHAPYPIEVDGGVFPSVREAALHFGIKPELANERIDRGGWSIGQALELDDPPLTARNRGVPVEVASVKYKSISEAANAYGLKASSVSELMRIRKCSCEEAIFRSRKLKKKN